MRTKRAFFFNSYKLSDSLHQGLMSKADVDTLLSRYLFPHGIETAPTKGFTGLVGITKQAIYQALS